MNATLDWLFELTLEELEHYLKLAEEFYKKIGD